MNILSWIEKAGNFKEVEDRFLEKGLLERRPDDARERGVFTGVIGDVRFEILAKYPPIYTDIYEPSAAEMRKGDWAGITVETGGRRYIIHGVRHNDFYFLTNEKLIKKMENTANAVLSENKTCCRKKNPT